MPSPPLYASLTLALYHTIHPTSPTLPYSPLCLTLNPTPSPALLSTPTLTLYPPCAYPEDYLHLVYVNIHPMLGDQMLYKLLILLKQGVI